MTDSPAPSRPLWFPILLIVGGVLGLWAAFSLTLDKFLLLQNPQADLDCNFNVLIQCGRNLDSWQGSLLGFPNSLIGLAAYVAPIAVGVGLLAGARFARWFWMLFHFGVIGALGFVIFLVVSSIYFLGTLCPWCMLVWSVTIPMFWAVTGRVLADGVYGERPRAVGAFLTSWLLPITVGSYAVIAILAQLRIDWLSVVF